MIRSLKVKNTIDPMLNPLGIGSDGFADVLDAIRQKTAQNSSQAWAEVDRRRGLGQSDQQIWLTAAREGEIEIVRAFIDQPPDGFDINVVDPETGQTALHATVGLIDFFAANPGGRTPDEARKYGLARTMDMLRLLVEDGGIDKAVLGKSDLSPFILSALETAKKHDRSPEMEQVADYLEKQLNMDAGQAVKEQDQARLDELIAAGASLAPIWLNAAMTGDIDMLKAFVRTPPKGFNINAADPVTGQTAIHRAVGIMGHIVANPEGRTSDEARAFGAQRTREVMELLVEEGGIDMAWRANAGGGDAGVSAYSIAAQYDRVPEMAELASYLKDQLNAQADEAAAEGNDRRLEELIASGADPQPTPGSEDAGDVRYGPPNSNWMMPETEQRSAEKIIAQTPILRDLDERSRRWLKNGFEWGDSTKDANKPFNGIGDYEKDPEKAWLAVKIMENIENYDAQGRRITSADIGDGRVNGFTKDMEAKPNTEAARFQDFTKDGFAVLRGGPQPPPPKTPPAADTKRPESDNRNAQEILASNPLLASLGDQERTRLKEKVGDYDSDADAAYRASRVLDHIEAYGPVGSIDDKNNRRGNHKIDGYFKTITGVHKANPRTEAARLQDFLKQETSEKAFELLKSYSSAVEADSEADGFVTSLKHEAYTREIVEADLPDDREDLLENPEGYSTQQRYAARLELMLTYDKIAAQPQHWDRTKLEQIQTSISSAIDTLSNEDVETYAGGHEPDALQAVLASDPIKREKASRMYDDIKQSAASLDKYIGEGKDNISGLADYYNVAETLNKSLGKEGEPLDVNLVVDVRNHPSYDLLEKEFKENYAKDDTLTKLVEEKDGNESEAMLEFSQRGAVFSGFGMPFIEEFAAKNFQQYYMKDVTPDDLKGTGVIDEDGEIDESFINDTLNRLRAEEPGSAVFKGEHGEALTNAQIVTATRAAVDMFRDAGKVVVSGAKGGNLARFLAQDSQLRQAVGSGMVHAVSSVLCAGIAISRGAQGDLSREEKIAIAANSLQAFGLGIQAFEFSQRPGNFHDSVLKHIWNANSLDGLTSDQITAHFNKKRDAVMYLGKALGGVGGMAAGAMGIFFGIQAKNQGDPGIAAVFFAQGLSDLLGAAGPISQVSVAAFLKTALGWGNEEVRRAILGTVSKWLGTIGTASLVLNAAALLAAVIYAVVNAANDQEGLDNYTYGFKDTLKAYGLPVEMANWPTTWR